MSKLSDLVRKILGNIGIDVPFPKYPKPPKPSPRKISLFSKPEADGEEQDEEDGEDIPLAMIHDHTLALSWHRDHKKHKEEGDEVDEYCYLCQKVLKRVDDATETEKKRKKEEEEFKKRKKRQEEILRLCRPAKKEDYERWLKQYLRAENTLSGACNRPWTGDNWYVAEEDFDIDVQLCGVLSFECIVPPGVDVTESAKNHCTLFHWDALNGGPKELPSDVSSYSNLGDSHNERCNRRGH